MTICSCLQQKTQTAFHEWASAFQGNTETRSHGIERSVCFGKHGERASMNFRPGSTMSWFLDRGQTPHCRTINSPFVRWGRGFGGNIAKQRKQRETSSFHCWPPTSRCHRDGPSLPTATEPDAGAGVPIRTFLQQLLYSGCGKIRSDHRWLQGSLENHQM